MLPQPDILDQWRKRAAAWFETLRDEIRTIFEQLEDELPPGAPMWRAALGGDYVITGVIGGGDVSFINNNLVWW